MMNNELENTSRQRLTVRFSNFPAKSDEILLLAKQVYNICLFF